jgi:predicted Zn-dependent protease
MSARDHFMALADALCHGLAAGEELYLRLDGEDSDFVRVSRARIRQAGTVAQQRLALALVVGPRQAEATVDLGGDPAEDARCAGEALTGLRALLPLLPEDPLLHWHRGDQREERSTAERPPEATVAVAAALGAADGLDLTGLWASGMVHAGFASSHGQRAWHSAQAWSFDWSCHRPDGQAVKGIHAGRTWDAAVWHGVMTQARHDLERFDLPRRRLEPGAYRVYLAPAAVSHLIGLLAWGGFSVRSRRTGSSPLMRLESGQAGLSPLLTLEEDAASGLAPLVTKHGFRRADRVVLIDHGGCGEALVSARSAREYGLPVNAGDEAPSSLRMAAGTLPAAEAMRALGTGLWIGNLHYLNYSDRSACRVTGMTRFACWWVEDGVPVAPIEHLRFDDTLFNLFGAQLEALTCERDLIPDTSTYEGRSLSTAEVPGALIRGMRFTL